MKSAVFLLVATASLLVFTIEGLKAPRRYVVKNRFGFNAANEEMPVPEEKIVIDDAKAESIKQCLQSFKSKENPHFKMIDFDAFSKEYIRCITNIVVPLKSEEQIPWKSLPTMNQYYMSGSFEKYVPVLVYKGISSLVDSTCESLGIVTKEFDYDLKIESSSPPTPLRDPRQRQVDCTANENPSVAKANNEFTTELSTERSAEVTMSDSSAWEFKAGFEFSLEKIGLSMGGGAGFGKGEGNEKATATSNMEQLTIGGNYETANRTVNVVNHALYEKRIEKEFSMEIIVKGWLYVAQGLQKYSKTVSMFTREGKQEDPNKFKYEYLYAFPVGDMAYFFDEFFTRVNAHSLIYKLYGELEEKVVDNFIRAKEYPFGSVQCQKKK